MARRTLPELFRSWAFRSPRLGRRSRDAITLGLETFEERVVPARLPTPTVVATTGEPLPVAASNAINPQVVAHPTNPQQQALVATTVTGAVLGVTLRYTFNGGGSWATAALPTNAFSDPLTGTNYTDASSPAVAVGRDGQVYVVFLVHNANKTSGAVFFARANTFGNAPGGARVLYQWATGGDPALNPSITVDTNVNAFTDPDSLVTFTDPLANRTTGRQAVYVAWNGNATANPLDVTSPTTAFNPNPIMATVSANEGNTWSNPTPVSNGAYMANPTNARGAAPQIAIAPGRAGAGGGELVFVWPQQSTGATTSRIGYDVSVQDQGLATTFLPQSYTFGGTTGNITDGVIVPPPPPPVPAPPTPPPPPPDDFSDTDYFTMIGAGGIPAGDTNTIQDLAVSIRLNSSRLDHLRLRLIAPNGVTMDLLTNRTDQDGVARPTGTGAAFPPGLPQVVTPANGGLGRNNAAVDSFTLFTDAASRRINDTNVVAPYIGAYRPEGTSTTATASTSQFRQFLQSAGLLGMPLTSLNSQNFRLQVRDFRNNRADPAAQSVLEWNMTFSSLTPGFGTDQAILGTSAPPLGGFDFNNAPTTTVSGGVLSTTGAGVAPAVSIAFDQSLGSFSPFGGRLYVAYTSGGAAETNIQVVRGTVGAGFINFGLPVEVNDDDITDNWTEGDRPQFTPAVAVDASTGTVVATWYDARLDANKTRAATFIATSLDGGATWSDQTTTVAESANNDVRPFLNQPKDAVDFITGTRYTLQPVPTNVSLAGNFGLGIRQSVIAAGGVIYAYWAGNLNAAGANIQSARAVIAGGPRVIAGDSGAVLTATGGYNTQLRPSDGTRGLDGITVTFDRAVNTVGVGHAEFAGSALNPANYQIRYRSPYNTTGFDAVFNPTSVVATGGNSFLMQFPVRFDVGTYSYSVSNVRDRVRTANAAGTVVTSVGNPMDQDADGTEGEANFDSFAMPRPVNGVPFVGPYATSSLPLIIPGPYMVGSAIPTTDPNRSPTDEDLVNAGAATAVDVTFDRDIDPTTFGVNNIVRIVGPAGVIYDRATAGGVTTGLTVMQPNTANDRTFRIGFPPQVLSGTYTVEVDAQIAGEVPLPDGPVRMDSNQNAGVAVLRGVDLGGTPANESYTANFAGPAANIQPAAGAVPGVTEFPLTVPDSFVIALANGFVPSVVLNVTSTAAVNNRVVDLVGDLIHPDGTVIRLFTNVGQATGRPLGTVWFGDTTLIDTATTSISTGFQPFSAGPYTPQFPLSDLAGKSSTGATPWRLRITNSGTETPQLNAWSLSLPQLNGGTGLGQDVADRFAVSFRVFNQDPTDNLTQKTWTPVGPAAENGQGNSSRTNAMAVDPSDPSGNTVYLGAGSSGLWKTKNFLTMDAGGPTWVPLGDGGPTYSLNVVSIALFPRNNDPNQTIVFAVTGEGDDDTPGVGVLRSMDGGRTWVVLDSLNNADVAGFGGNVTPVTAASRDREFYGKTAYKIIVDPTPVGTTEQNVIVYAAFGSLPGEPGGIYRSVDSGRHWTLMRAGNANDIVLAEGSDATGTGLLQILYGSFRGEGVYRANPAYVASGPNAMVFLSGTPTGNGSFIDGDVTAADRVEITAPQATPNGTKGRVLLATPARTNNRADDLNYQGWLYALVVTADGNFDGLYVTKDYGGNWTKVRLPELRTPAAGIPLAGYGTNNYTRAEHNVFGAAPGTPNPLPAQGNYDVAFAIDPNNPNVLYIGGMNSTALGPNGGMIRVDTTGVFDAGAVVAYDNSNAGANDVQFTVTAGNVVTKTGGTSQLTNAPLGPGQPYGFTFPDPPGSDTNLGYLNVLRDPNDPFNTAATFLTFTNVDRIRNTGFGARYSAFPAEVNTDVHRIITVVDPLTGLTRLLVGDDQGIASAIDDGRGNIILSVGDGPQRQNLPELVRNGNLQTIQFYSSAVQPSQLAAEIANAMFYGEAQDNGFPVSNPFILQTGVGDTPSNGDSPGKLSWTGPGGDGSWGATDQTGSGAYYDYKWPCCGGSGEQFFQINGQSRTFGLVQPDDVPTTGVGNWNITGGPKFAVNPVDGNGILMGSIRTGRLFLTVDRGVTWRQVAGPDPGTGTGSFTLYRNLNGNVQAAAFGAPSVQDASLGQLNNFLYVGVGNTVWVSFTGGTDWTALPAVSGGVEQIVPDPARGSRAVYVVTGSGVFFKADSGTATAWTNISGTGANNILAVTDPIFSDPNAAPATPGSVPSTFRGLTSLAVDWRYAIPDTRPGAPSPFFPVLYAGGYGGVARSLDRGQTWQIYPVGSDHTASYVDQATGLPGTVVTAIPSGGYFPSVEVTQLSLSFGNIDPTTGLPIQQTGGLNMLTAATYGRGTWVIRLEDFQETVAQGSTDPNIIAAANSQVVKQSGPRVKGVTVVARPNNNNPEQAIFEVLFEGPVLAETFTTADIVIRDSAGNPLQVVSVTPLFRAGAGGNDQHDLFQVVVRAVNPTAITDGFADITIGPGVFDYAGFGMNQDDDFDNGETALDPNNGNQAADAYHGFLQLDAAVTEGSLHISQPVVTRAGDPTRVTISALAANGAVNAGYRGTITLTTTINGRQAVLTDAPVSSITGLSQVGTTVTATTAYPVAFVAGQTVQIGGVVTGGYNGEFVVTSVAGDMLSFTYTAATAGLPADAAGGSVAGPFIPVAATSGTPTPVPSGALPATFTFLASHQGDHVFTIFYLAASSPVLVGGIGQTLLSVEETHAVALPSAPLPTANRRRAQAFITVTAGLATQFRVDSIPDPVVAGVAGAVRVKALDPYFNIDPTYAGTVTFTSTDVKTSTVLPVPYTFVPGTDAGLHVFSPPDGVTLTTAGVQRVTATDATNPLRTLTGFQDVLVLPAQPATVILTGLPTTTVAGTMLSVTVRLEDAFGNLATNYTGTMSFASSDTNTPFTQLPATYTFTSGTGLDNGIHTFTNEIILTRVNTAPPGTQSITVSTGTVPVASATANVQVTPAAVAQVIVDQFPATITAGVAGTVRVTLRDMFGNLATNHTGTVTFSSTDPNLAQRVLPPVYTFTTGLGRDNGVHIFPSGVTLVTAGPQTITVTANATGAVGSLNTVVTPAAVNMINVAGFPDPVVAGVAGTVTVTLFDRFGNQATNFTGSVALSSTDAQNVLPAAHTFTSGVGMGFDNGQYTFTGVELRTATSTARFPGLHTITATTGAVSGTQADIDVTPAATSKLTVAGYGPNPVTAGTTGSVTVTALDPFDNITPAYTGTVSFADTTGVGPLGLIPTDYTFTGADAGVHLFSNAVRLTLAGTQSITVRDTANALITGTQAPVNVVAAAANTLTVTGFPSSVVAGSSNTLTVTLFDPFGNVATGFTGNVSFASTDPNTAQRVLPATAAFTSAHQGTRMFSGVRLVTATGTATFPGLHSISATVVSMPSITGSQTGIEVTPAATSQFTVGGYGPNPVTAGTVGSVTVTARDPFSNVTPAYRGTVRFNETTGVGPMGFVPANYTFTAGDAGVHAFNNEVRLTLAGNQTITARDTVTASITGSQSPVQVVAAAASTLTLTGFPPAVTAGQLGTVTVTLRDPFGNLATGYAGTVTFSSTDAGSQTLLPTGAQAIPGGQRTFTNGVRLTTATGTPSFPGTHTITATDGALTGTQANIVVVPAAPALVSVTGFPATVTAGQLGTVTVTLRDQYNNLATNYTGPLTFTSTDLGTQTLLPNPYTFTGADAGAHTFTNEVRLTTATGTATFPGTHAITASTGAATGSQIGITVTPAATARFDVAGFPATVTAGVPGTVTVTARDTFGNLTPAYAGTVRFTSTDVGTSTDLPDDYTFVPGTDNGVHAFPNETTLTTATGTATFPGTHTITATDTATASITGAQANIAVTPAAVASVAVTGFPPTVTAGTPGSVTVTVRDRFNNLATNFTGQVTFSSTDTGSQTDLPDAYTFTSGTGFDNGVHVFTNEVTLTTAGPQTIRATANAVTGELATTVTPAAASRFDVAGFPSPVVAGTPGTVTVTARDPFGNVATGYGGTVSFTSTDTGTQRVLPGNYTFQPGDAGVRTFTDGVTLTTVRTAAPGTQSITVTDTVAGSVTGTQAGIVVTPAAAASLTLTGYPSPVTAGTTGSVTATLRDTFGNVATGFTGTLSFTSTDTGSQTDLPDDYTFTGGDAGVHTFTNGVRLTTVGTQSITATSGGLVGSRTGIQVNPAAAARLALGSLPTRVAAGDANRIGITALDAFGNTATGYAGPLTVTSTDPRAQFRTPVPLLNGVGSVDVVFATRNAQSVRVADPGNGALAGTVATTVFFDLAETFAAGGTSGSQTVFEYGGNGTPTADFPNRYGGGSRVVSADFNGDGVPDLAIGTGPGTPSEVVVFDGRTKDIIFTVDPFQGFTGGVFLAAGHISGTDKADLIIAPDEGGGPRIQLYAGGTFAKFGDFLGIEDKDFRGGARPAAGDLDGDGFAELVVAAGFMGGPRISVYDGAALTQGRRVHPINDFFAFEDTLRNGAFAAVGDVDGDGFGDMIFGAGPGGAPRVLIVSGRTVMTQGADAAFAAPLSNFFAGSTSNFGGIRVAAKNLDGDRFADVVTGDGVGSGSRVRAYKGTDLIANNTTPAFAFDAFDGINTGVFVG